MNGGTRPSVWARIVLLLGSLGFVVATAEVGLRVLWENPYAGEDPDQLLKIAIQHPGANSWIDRSAFDTEIPRVRFRADDRAYIEPARVHADPQVSVTFLGGSTTACNAVREELRFPALVGSLLSERGIRTNGLNAARSSGTLHDSLNVFLNHIVQDEPDIVVVMHATNDIGILKQERGYARRSGAPVAVLDLAKWSLQILSGHSSLVALARRAQVPTERRGGFDAMEEKNAADQPKVPTDPFRARLETFVESARSFGIEPVLMTQPLSSSRNALTPDWADLGNQDIFNAVIRQVASEKNALLIDLVSHLQRDVPGWDEPMHIFYDGMHVTDLGSEVYAKHIADQLEPLARKVVARE
jgi:lysophospholipase L1-like esterase